MLKIETINNLLGFGESGKNGEYYFSVGMQRKNNLLEESWRILNNISNTSSGSIEHGNWFSEMVVSGATSTIFTTNNINGKIFGVLDGNSNWTLLHSPATISHGNGLIVNQNNKLLYAQDRWLGMYDPDTSVWNDSWKDLGGVMRNSSWPRSMDVFEDWVMIGGESNVVALNTTDDSINTTAFTLPNGFVIRDFKSGSNGILIGVNFGGKGILILWDGLSDRSISPWIWLENEVKSISKADGNWIVSYGKQFIVTNGFSISEVIDPPVEEGVYFTNFTFSPAYPSGMLYHNKKLFVSIGDANNSIGLYELGKYRRGIYIYDFRTKLWEFCPGVRFSQTMRALFKSSASNFYVSAYYSDTVKGSLYILGTLVQRLYSDTKSFLITGPIGKGNTIKKAEGIILDLEFSKNSWLELIDPSVTVTAKIYNLRKKLWKIGQTNAVSTSLSELKVDGTSVGFNNANIGDEVTIMTDRNAGEIRNITSISGQDTANEVWTVDSPFTYLTESGVNISICPFEKVSEKSLNINEIKNNLLFFGVKNNIVGKHFMLKIDINRGSLSVISTPIAINNISLVYEELGIN